MRSDRANAQLNVHNAKRLLEAATARDFSKSRLPITPVLKGTCERLDEKTLRSIPTEKLTRPIRPY
jgi:hypothetical protein